jgi:anti-sigma factor RsiW
MQRPSDEALIAYLDGELEGAARQRVVDALERDAELRDRADSLTEAAARLRAAFDEVLREDVPARLLAAARSEVAEAANVIDFAEARGRRLPEATPPRRWDDRRWFKAAVAASLLCLVIGAGGGYFASRDSDEPQVAPATSQTAAASNWLDNVAGYHELLIKTGGNGSGLAGMPPTGAQHAAGPKLPAGFRLPNLKSWGLAFVGARFLVIEGRPATQLFYDSANKKLGSITIVVGSSEKPDMLPATTRRDGMNFIYWRHKGHAYALVGGADVGYLRNIAKDIAFQLGASA